MSVFPAVSEKTQSMELAMDLPERPRPQCWPLLNGYSHQHSSTSPSDQGGVSSGHQDLPVPSSTGKELPTASAARNEVPAPGPGPHELATSSSAHEQNCGESVTNSSRLDLPITASAQQEQVNMSPARKENTVTSSGRYDLPASSNTRHEPTAANNTLLNCGVAVPTASQHNLGPRSSPHHDLAALRTTPVDKPAASSTQPALPVTSSARHEQETVSPARHELPPVSPTRHELHTVSLARHEPQTVSSVRHELPGVSPARHELQTVSLARHDPPTMSPARHDLPAMSPARHELPTMSPARHELPAGSPARHDLPAMSPARHELPSVSPARHELPAMNSARHELPTPSPTRHDLLVTSTVRSDLSTQSAARHDLPAVSPARHELPTTSNARHNLPPISAITSRPSSSSIPKPLLVHAAPPRAEREEDVHVFAQPNPPRLAQPAARAPTPFPHPTSPSPHSLLPLRLEPRPPVDPPALSSNPSSSTTVRSAFASVQRVSPPSEGMRPVGSDPSQSATSTVGSVTMDAPKVNLTAAFAQQSELIESELRSKPEARNTLPPVEAVGTDRSFIPLKPDQAKEQPPRQTCTNTTLLPAPPSPSGHHSPHIATPPTTQYSAPIPTHHSTHISTPLTSHHPSHVAYPMTSHATQHNTAHNPNQFPAHHAMHMPTSHHSTSIPKPPMPHSTPSASHHSPSIPKPPTLHHSSHITDPLTSRYSQHNATHSVPPLSHHSSTPPASQHSSQVSTPPASHLTASIPKPPTSHHSSHPSTPPTLHHSTHFSTTSTSHHPTHSANPPSSPYSHSTHGTPQPPSHYPSHTSYPSTSHNANASYNVSPSQLHHTVHLSTSQVAPHPRRMPAPPTSHGTTNTHERPSPHSTAHLQAHPTSHHYPPQTSNARSSPLAPSPHPQYPAHDPRTFSPTSSVHLTPYSPQGNASHQVRHPTNTPQHHLPSSTSSAPTAATTQPNIMSYQNRFTTPTPTTYPNITPSQSERRVASSTTENLPPFGRQAPPTPSNYLPPDGNVHNTALNASLPSETRRNYSNQNHRYFATPPATDAVRGFPPTSHDTSHPIRSSHSSPHPLVNPSDLKHNLPAPTDQRRFGPPAARAYPGHESSSAMGGYPMPNERFSHQGPIESTEQFRNFQRPLSGSPKQRNGSHPGDSNAHQVSTSTDVRSYTPHSSERHPTQGGQGAAFYGARTMAQPDGGPQSAEGPRHGSRQGYPLPSHSDALSVRSLASHNERGGNYPHPLAGATDSHHEQRGAYPHPLAAATESMRNASRGGKPPLPQQGLRPQPSPQPQPSPSPSDVSRQDRPALGIHPFQQQRNRQDSLYPKLGQSPGFLHQGDRNLSNYSAPVVSSRNNTPPSQRSSPYYPPTATSLPGRMGADTQTSSRHGSNTSVASITMTPAAQGKPAPSSLHQGMLHTHMRAPGAQLSPNIPYSTHSTPNPTYSSQAPDPSRLPWGPPGNPYLAKAAPSQSDKPPQNYRQSHPTTYYGQHPPAAKDRECTGGLPRINPPAVVSVSSTHTPRFSAHPSQSQSQSSFYMNAPRTPANSQVSASLPCMPTASSSSSLPGLPRVNFPAVSFNGAVPVASAGPYVSSRGSAPVPSVSTSSSQPGEKQQLSSVPAARQQTYPTGQAFMYPQHQGRPVSSIYAPPGRQAASAGSQYAPTRGHPMETDTCRNPFELPAPTNQHHQNHQSTGVIKTHQGHAAGYNLKPAASPDATKNSDSAQFMARYAMPSPRTEQRSASGSDDRPKPHTVSARFPPVPQSNYDLQRQIYDRMTGLQQGPPRLLDKSRTEDVQARPKVEAVPAPGPAARQKRESPLDLSVKTVRQSADSTRDDVDLYLAKHFSPESRLASAPKIDFNPNFGGPLVQPETRNVSLPPVQSIRKFQAPVEESLPFPSRKRPLGEQEALLPPKMPKVDAWKLAMDEQIEERLKAARQSRQPAAPLTPLHPPAQSITPTNPDVLHPPARPLPNEAVSGGGRLGARGWSAGVFQPPSADPERLMQQISQGVMPDSRFLQDRNVVDMLRSSLEEKEQRLQALQAAARRRQTLPPFDALERMCVPPSHPLGHALSASCGAQPVPIGVEPSRHSLMRGAEDMDGLAAFLAARIRTKAEMKQMGPAEHFRPPDSQDVPASVLGLQSPPRLAREGRQAAQRRGLMSPSSSISGDGSIKPMQLPGNSLRDPAGLRSSSETSVFDFRESDSEGEMPVLERQTLDGMRRPRKTQPRVAPGEPSCSEPRPGPALRVPDADPDADGDCDPEPDPAWDNACDMFVEQLQKGPIKRSVRKKRPNPKFFATESEAPNFMKVKTEPSEEVTWNPAEGGPSLQASVEVKQEVVPANLPLPPLPVVPKEESSSEEELVGVTIVREGRVKLVTRRQRAVASDSEWGSSAAESSVDESASSAASESDEDSDDSTVQIKRRARARGASSSGDEQGRGKSRRKSRPAASGSDDGSGSDASAPAKRRRPRTRLVSDSASEQSDAKSNGRRTRSRPLSESGDESDSKPKGPRTRTRAASASDGEGSVVKAKTKGKGSRVQTRLQARSVHAPARMRLRSKKRGAAKGAAFRPGWETDLVKFKQHLRMPDRLISGTKSNKRSRPASLADSDELPRGARSGKKGKKDKKGLNEKESSVAKAKPIRGKLEKGGDRPSSAPPLPRRRSGVVTRGTGKLRPRGLRASVGMRRSHKAVQNSKRRLNNAAHHSKRRLSTGPGPVPGTGTGKKRLKLRRKFRSGLDYMRRKKKVPRKDEPTPAEPAPPVVKLRAEPADISAEVKTWVVNKSAGETVLHRAARLAHLEAAEYCLASLRLPPSPRDHAGYTPLHEACSRGHVAVAACLLQHGASVSESARGGVRPLHQAAENNHLELVRLLLAYGADPLLATYTGQSALTLTTSDAVRDLIHTHLADVQGSSAPPWPFQGPATAFDPSWVVDPLESPPSPGPLPHEVEMEASAAMLPPLYRLPPSDEESADRSDSADRWLLLADLVTYLHAPSADGLLARLPGTPQRSLTDVAFRERAIPCNMLCQPALAPVAGCGASAEVSLVRYDEAVRQLLQVEVLTVSLVDQ